MGKKRLALFHPWIKSRGGAERLILEYAKNSKFKIDFYTWIYDKNNTFTDFKKFKVIEIPSKYSRKFYRKKILRGLYFSLIKTKIPLKNYAKFLVSTSGIAEKITNKNKIPGNTFAYVHTPLRDATKEDIAWNLERKNFLERIFYRVAVSIYKLTEKSNWANFDKTIFNSDLSLSRALDRDLTTIEKSVVINPPIDPNFKKDLKLKDGKYFLYVSRLNNKKRQDLLIRAWKNFSRINKDYRLIIAGDIEDKNYFHKLKRLQKKTERLEILTELNDKKINHLINNCSAFIFIPFREDFGMLPFEVLSVGKQLIATDVGGYVGILKPNKHFHPIRERESEKDLETEITRSLESFVKNKNKKFEKLDLTKFSSKNFAKKLDAELN